MINILLGGVISGIRCFRNESLHFVHRQGNCQLEPFQALDGHETLMNHRQSGNSVGKYPLKQGTSQGPQA